MRLVRSWSIARFRPECHHSLQPCHCVFERAAKSPRPIALCPLTQRAQGVTGGRKASQNQPLVVPRGPLSHCGPLHCVRLPNMRRWGARRGIGRTRETASGIVMALL